MTTLQSPSVPRRANEELPPVGTKIRVTIVAPSLRSLGGQSVQAALLLRHWADDPEIAVSFVGVDQVLPSWLHPVERVPFVRTVARLPFYFITLWKHAGRSDILHIFSASYWSFLVAVAPAWLVGRIRGKKTLINYRSGEARDHLARWRSAHAVLSRATGIVVPSRFLQVVFAEFGLQAQVVPNIADMSQLKYRERCPLRPRLVCTRNFEPYYGIDTVLRAFQIVKTEFPEASLLLVGSGSLEAEMRSLVQELQLKDVTFVGRVDRGEIGGYYEAADIFVNGSRLDNMPVSIVEAFAAGTPVVSTAPEGIRYLVRHGQTGLLSPPDDHQQLAANVTSLLRQPERALAMARLAHEESKQFSWPAVRTQWSAVYRSALNARGDARVEISKEEPTGE